MSGEELFDRGWTFKDFGPRKDGRWRCVGKVTLHTGETVEIERRGDSQGAARTACYDTASQVQAVTEREASK